jgi:hypothetical protein
MGVALLVKWSSAALQLKDPRLRILADGDVLHE